MTIATDTDARQFPSTGRFFQNLVRNLFSIDAFERANQEITAPVPAPDPLAHLMEKIDNGYTVEETGEHITLPGHARAYARTLVENGGWG